MKLDVPSSSQSARIGSLNRKHATYDIWSVGDDDNQPVGGEEIKELTCLLPRKKKVKLYQGEDISFPHLFPALIDLPRAAPKPITRHIVISAQSVLPTPDSSESTSDSSRIFQNPPRQYYAKELLKHRFLPYGSQAPGDEELALMDVDIERGKERPLPVESQLNEGKKGKGKKRKGDEETPKKSKKAKTAV